VVSTSNVAVDLNVRGNGQVIVKVVTDGSAAATCAGIAASAAFQT
jgi:hypothetical protein